MIALMDGDTMAAGAVLFMVGMLLGALLVFVAYSEGEKRQARRAAATPKPVCTCTHARGMHKDGKGLCNVTTYLSLTAVSLNSKGLNCPCVMYDGPIPMDEIYAREVLP